MDNRFWITDLIIYWMITDLITNWIRDWIIDWITNLITNRRNKEATQFTEKKRTKLTKMTCKLQIVITFVTVVRLRPTICQNAQNLEENSLMISKGDLVCKFCQKMPLAASNLHSKIKHPLSFFFFSNFLQLYLCTIFFFSKTLVRFFN